MRALFILSVLIISFPLNIAAAGGDSLTFIPYKSPDLKIIIPGIAGFTAASLLVDEPVNDFFRANQTGFFNSAARYSYMAGEKTIVVPALLVTYGTARFLLKDSKLQTTSVKALQSVIVTAVATEGIKYLAGRARPFTRKGAYSFHPLPGGKDEFKSLPSGHASLAFALFTPYAETYSRWIYLVPASVALGRAYMDKHWISDIFLGGGIGLISGILFTHHENIQIIPNGLRIYF